MATELLFELDSIDLDALAVGPEEVADINPQSGPMRQLDHVIWFSDDLSRSVGVKQVTHEEFWIPYHIPGRPLMPGVLMIEAAAQLCSVHFRVKMGITGFLGFVRCDDVVFRGQVTPGQTLYLLSDEISCSRRRSISNCQAVVDGLIAFEGKITGMTI